MQARRRYSPLAGSLALLVAVLPGSCAAEAQEGRAPGAKAVAGSQDGQAAPDLRKDFADPPLKRKPRPLWFWNALPSKEATHSIMEQCRASGYYGFGILPTEKMKLEFMSPVYLDRYQEAVDKAAALGMKMCLYDEFWFPSGAAGGQLARQFPEALGKRLDVAEFDVDGPSQGKPFAAKTGPGKLMAAVSMHRQTKERIDLSAQVKDSELRWSVPAGQWKVMLFTCVTDGARGLVDYLDPQAVEKFISLTYEKYYRRFPGHFGRTIDSAFYDEPTFHWIQGGRAWTGAFNERFEKKHGRSPALLYPALWHDIGPETAAARNAMFGLRAELFATGFVKTLNDWCRAHKIELTGHVDQEEIVNPVGLCGDLIKAFQHQDIPAIDQVFQYGRASKAYKIVSSAASNFDRPLVVTECYGGVNNMPVANLYKEAMDQFAKGINCMVPHAVWYSAQGIIFPPNLTPGDPTYGPELPAYNCYVGRLQRMLQGGRHVADVGVLYPIATLQAGYYFGPGKPYEGGVIPPEADYMDVGERLALGVRRDFTFVHPEALDERCKVAGAEIRLENKVNAEQYKVFVIPGSTTIAWSNLRKIKEFFDQGGKVIATTRLPDRSAEFGRDAEVRAAIEAMFGPEKGDKSNLCEAPGGPLRGKLDLSPFSIRANPAGGKAYFAPSPRADVLRAIMDDALPVCDVAIEGDVKVSGGNLSYIHKAIGGRSVYFFANSSETPVDVPVRLRGKLPLEAWDPHTGQISSCQTTVEARGGVETARVRLRLAPVRSVFLVERLGQ